MNLHENIHRIHQMMGVINEDDKSAKISKMIDKMGLYYTIKLFGGYDTIKNMYGDSINLTNEQKIGFIKDVVQDLSKETNSTGVSIYTLGLNAIPYGTPDDNGNAQQIEYFYSDTVSIDVYHEYYHKLSYNMKYTDLDDKSLDDVFLFMVDALNYYK